MCWIKAEHGGGLDRRAGSKSNIFDNCGGLRSCARGFDRDNGNIEAVGRSLHLGVMVVLSRARAYYLTSAGVTEW